LRELFLLKGAAVWINGGWAHKLKPRRVEMKEKAAMGRREFMGKAALAALAVPIVLEGGTKSGDAVE
jgi:hypothetical protein